MPAAVPLEIVHPAILFTINRLYRENMSDLELYEATRGVWLLGPRREKAKYAMAVYQGIVREVYKIIQWYPAGTIPYTTRLDLVGFDMSGRWEFTGELAINEIRNLYKGHFVGKGGQNPVRYVNVG